MRSELEVQLLHAIKCETKFNIRRVVWLDKESWQALHVNNLRSSFSKVEENHAAHYMLEFMDEFYMRTRYADELEVVSSYVVACYTDVNYMKACYTDQIKDAACYMDDYEFNL